MSIYKLSDLKKPIVEKNISVCDRLKIKVSPTKKCVLVNSISDDTAKTSYYGQSSLYFVDVIKLHITIFNFLYLTYYLS